MESENYYQVLPATPLVVGSITSTTNNGYIQFKNGSKIETIPCKDSIRSKGFHYECPNGEKIILDYTEIIEDLNEELYDKYCMEAIDRGFNYTHLTDGGWHIISYFGVEVFNDECDSSTDIYGEDDNDYLNSDLLKQYIKNKVKEIGERFIKFSN